MDLTKEQKEILVEALTVLKFDVEEEKNRDYEDFADIVRRQAFVEKSDVVLYPKLSDADRAIAIDKVCPYCQGDLTYDQADPSGKDADIYFCENCMEKDMPTDNDQDLPNAKEYHITYEKRIDGYHVIDC